MISTRSVPPTVWKLRISTTVSRKTQSLQPLWWRPSTVHGDSSDRTKNNTKIMSGDNNNNNNNNHVPDVEDLHAAALLQKSTTYTDPATGFVVFTERAHLLRGTCCGNQCRHCPYGWENVNNASMRRPALVASGDKEAIRARLAAQDAAAAAATKPPRTTAHPPTTRPLRTGGRHGGRLTDKNVPYTRGGDTGQSSLLTGERRSKTDAAFVAMGTVDELCSVVGVVQAAVWRDYGGTHTDAAADTANHDKAAVLTEHLLEIMSRLFDIGSHVAKPRPRSESSSDESSWSESDNDDDGGGGDADTPKKTKVKESRFVADGIGGGFDPAHVQVLEDWIDVLTNDLPELTSFLLPTGTLVAAQLHVARTVCRRAERTMVPLVQAGVCDPTALKYVNRLSDYFFTAARWANVVLDKGTEIQYRKPHRSAKQRTAVVGTTRK